MKLVCKGIYLAQTSGLETWGFRFQAWGFRFKTWTLKFKAYGLGLGA